MLGCCFSSCLNILVLSVIEDGCGFSSVSFVVRFWFFNVVC